MDTKEKIAMTGRNLTERVVTRIGMFETNSSSTHSMTIAEGWPPDKAQTLPLDAGVCHIYSGEFGWEPETYSSAEAKASYAYTFAVGSDNKDRLRMLREVIEEQTGCSEVKFEKEDNDYYPHGYIDHQSLDVAARAFESKDALRRFIFHPGSSFETDNDNH